MDVIFQQAPFDDRKDIKRIEEIAEEVERRMKAMPGFHYGECSRCKRRGPGLARILDGQFICRIFLITDEVNRQLMETNTDTLGICDHWVEET